MLKQLLPIFLSFALFAQDSYISLKGYLGSEVIASAEEQMREAEEKIVIQVNSSSGDIHEVLALSKQIYDLKAKGEHSIIVYIQGKAVGPAAIFPFLADKLIVTPLVAWGDIPYGVEEHMESSGIQSAVKSLINQKTRQAATLNQLANAMTDPHYKLLFGDGDAKIERESQAGRFDPVILNLNGIQSLGLVDSVIADEDVVVSQIMTKENLTQQLQKYISYSESEENLVGYLHVGSDRSIDQSTYIYLKFALKEFVERKVRFVVLDLNTPGGEVFAALKIVDLLQKLDIQYNIPVVAFIHDWAVSAGAMLAYSCRFIAIEPNSIMGAAEPVIAAQGGQAVTASEKVNSALRAEFANLATFYGRDPLIAEAMVDKDIILVIRNHQVVKLRDEDEMRNSDSLITGKGKLLTLNARQLIDYGVADFEVEQRSLPPITEAEREAGAWPAEKMLLFQQPYLAKIPNAVIVDFKDWRVGFFSILSHPVVASLLFIGLVLGLYIEINTPGFGIPGAIGLACLFLILLSSFASQAINWIEVIILAVGLLLLALELFVIPGFGVAGILGIIFMIVGLFALMLPGLGSFNIFDPETFRLVGEAFVERLAWLSGALIFAILVIIILAKFFSHRYFRFSKLVLRGEQDRSEGYVSGIPLSMMPKEGAHGETVTPLRPSGKVQIGEELFDAITQGSFLKANVAVEVLRIEGNKVVVEPIEKEESDS
ncbi:MAG: hypothetical protein K1060chlam2_00869 [Chlamydiae bacterium]|nr:hypothetical protein [Chlamydiota bacterium]